MTPKKLADSMGAYADAIEDPLIAQCVRDLSNLVKTLQVPKGRQLSDVVASRLTNSPVGSVAPSVGEVHAALEPLRRILTIVSTPKAGIEIHGFFTLLQQNKDMSFSIFLSRTGSTSGDPSPEVEQYVEELQRVVADPEVFQEVVSRLSKDKAIKPDDLSDITSGFTGLRKKWGRKAAFEALWAKHSAHMKAVRSFRTANGKSAA